MEKKAVTRRVFLSTTVAGLGGAALAGIGVANADEAEQQTEPATPPSWLGTEPQTPSEFAQELECDVVVCGLGIAGTAAMRAAAEAGARVIGFDKSDATRCSNEICAFGSPTYAANYPDIAALWKDSIPFLLNAVSNGCLCRNNTEILRHYLEHNGEVIDWYFSVAGDACEYASSENPALSSEAELGVYETCYPLPEHYNPFEENAPCMPGTYRMGGTQGSKGFLTLNQQAACDLGAQIFTYTPVIKLTKDENGRVNGVIAQDADKNYIKVSATHGVIVSCGDFLNDQAMMEALLPDVLNGGYVCNGPENYYTTFDADGMSCNTGDGHRMAIWAGAAMQAFPATMSHFSKSANSSVFGTMPYLMLDANGKRFMNEDVQGQQFCERIRQLPGRRAIMIFDDAFEDQMPWMPYGHGKLPHTTHKDVEDRIEMGLMVKADTLEELLENFDIDVDAALESIERYNELAKNGLDEDFGKVASRMFAIETPPYYANYMTRGDDLVSVSGIVSDTKAHACDANGKPVPGLYVAGNCQGGRWATIYPEIFMGYSVGMAMFYGHEAGINAMSD